VIIADTEPDDHSVSGVPALVPKVMKIDPPDPPDIVGVYAVVEIAVTSTPVMALGGLRTAVAELVFALLASGRTEFT